jgi:hypothetical protein
MQGTGERHGFSSSFCQRPAGGAAQATFQVYVVFPPSSYGCLDNRTPAVVPRLMDRIEQLIAALSQCACGGYRTGGTAATEPTALAALALIGHGRHEIAATPLEWLARQQQPDGGVGITAGQHSPAWPTGLAVLAWHAAQHLPGHDRFRVHIDRGRDWILAARGESLPRNEFLAHDSTLVGWPWVAGTHSWVEPTAIQLLALNAIGCLPHGGWNYGNTVVLGQELRPHLLPTALSLLALANESRRDERIQPSLEYLTRELPRCAAAPSLAYGILALSAHGRRPQRADDWLRSAIQHALARDAATLPMALLALAAAPAGLEQIVPIHRGLLS